MKTILSFLLGLSLAAGSFLGAQEFAGTLSSGLGWWVQGHSILPTAVLFESGIKGTLGDGANPAAQYLARVRVGFDSTPGSASPTAATSMALDEAWIKVFLGPLDFCLGNQVVAWGATDAFAPIDIVNPLDLSLPVASRKLPTAMGRVILNGQGFSLDLVALPVWAASLLPDTRWQTATASFTPPTGIVVDSRNVVTDTPQAIWDNTQYGGRLAASLEVFQGWDLGFSYFHGIATTPTASTAMQVVSPGHVTVTVTKSFDRYSLLGFDTALALEGGLLLKGEAAYRLLDGGDWLEPAAGLASATGVGGLEYRIAGIKAIGEFALDWAKGATSADDSLDKTLIVALSADPDSSLSLKLRAGYSFDGSYFASPEMAYTITDGLKASLSGYAFFGETGTRFGEWKDNDLAEFKLSYSF